MSVVQTLFAAEPLTLAATYDKIWVSEVVVASDNPQAGVTARVRLRRFRTLDGQADFSPEPPLWLEVDSLLERAATDAQLAGVVQGLMAYIARVGVEQGVIAPPA